MATSMRAALFLRPYELTVRSVPLPEPGPGDVVIALEGTGVCASNLPLWEGAPWFQYPLEPGTGGHEGWGRVERVGEGVDSALLGKRVAALSYRAYAERDIARAEHVVELPDALRGVPFPGEALGCAMNIFARSGIKSGHTVAIVGVGFLGAILTRLASRAGAQVIAISRRPFAREVAERMGATHTIAMDDHTRIIERVRELSGGRFCDVTIEAAGKQWPLDLSAELTCEGGRLVVAGYHQDGPRQVNMQLWNWRGFDVINAHERDPKVSLRGMREAVHAVTEGVFDPLPLFTHSYNLAELGVALSATSQRPDGFLKAIIRTEVKPC